MGIICPRCGNLCESEEDYQISLTVDKFFEKHKIYTKSDNDEWVFFDPLELLKLKEGIKRDLQNE